MSGMKSLITSISGLSFPMKTLDPFLFCVYHKDFYPAGDEYMRAPKKGNGADFDPNAPYRMYHGDRIPGFPQHPHRGFETITATISGIIDHTDSTGNAGRYGMGDLQWMTAGKGIVHGEMFPLINTDKPNPLKLFQIWLNLPAISKMVDPAFVMHWANEVPKYTSPDNKVTATIWGGFYGDRKALPPPPNSWANLDQDFGIFYIQIAKGGSFLLPGVTSAGVNRVAYFIEGKSLKIGDTKIPPQSSITLDAQQDAFFSTDSDASDLDCEILILQARPIGEPVAQSGPFVMNTQQEIQQAYSDYRKTQFGGWPWSDDAVVFPPTKDRFALINGVEMYPPK